MSDYEQKDNSGALFQSNNMRVLRQGNSMVNGFDCDLIVTESKTKDGRTMYDTYMKVGGFFPNKYKEDGDSKPDITAPVNINGEKMRLAGWKNTSKRGTPYVKLSFKPADEDATPTSTPTPQAEPPQSDMPNDDIPF